MIVEIESFDLIRSKEWFLNVDHLRRSSRLSKTSRTVSSSNRSSPYKYPRRFSSDDQKPKKSNEINSVDHTEARLLRNKSQTSLSSVEISDVPLSFPPPPSASREFYKADGTSAYSMTDEQQEENLVESALSFHQTAPVVPPLRTPASDSTREKQNELDETKRGQALNRSTSKAKTATNAIVDGKDSLRKSNTFTSSSHSMIDPGCGGHLLSKIPALRCFRSHKQHQTQKFEKISPCPPPPLVLR